MPWSLFWILFLVVGGLGLIVIGAFGMKMPTGRWLFAVFLILLGIKLLVGEIPDGIAERKWDDEFSDTLRAGGDQNKEINIVFQSGTILLDPGMIGDGTESFSVNTVFGITDLVVPDTLNVHILVDAVFSSCVFPDGRNLHFGSDDYVQENNNASGTVNVRADVVFGTFRIRQENTGDPF